MAEEREVPAGKGVLLGGRLSLCVVAYVQGEGQREAKATHRDRWN